MAKDSVGNDIDPSGGAAAAEEDPLALFADMKKKKKKKTKVNPAIPPAVAFACRSDSRA